MPMREAPLTMLERLQYRAARWALSLPPSVQVRLSGKPPVVRDGLTLHPELQLMLSLRERLGAKELSVFSPEEARRRLKREALVHAGEELPVRSVREFTIDGPERPLTVRHYVPDRLGDARDDDPQPLLVFLHGGGFVVGDLDTHDPACRMLCREGGVHVLSVDYRLAPEEPFPAAVEDALAAFRWASSNAHALGADPAKVAIGGDSAGGNLSAVVAQIAVEDGGPLPALQLLLYPTVDRTTNRPSIDLFADGFFLTRNEMDWFQAHYTGGPGAPLHDPRISPLRGQNLAGLPRALVVTAGFDPLRDEGEAYAAALREAGTPVEHRRYEGFIHGFINMGGISDACRDAVGEIARWMRAHLDHEHDLESRSTR